MEAAAAVRISLYIGVYFNLNRHDDVWQRSDDLVDMGPDPYYAGKLLPRDASGFRALSMAAAGLLFGLTTRPVSLFYSLMQQWKLPPKYAYSFLAAMRLIPMMLEEFQALRHAHRIRGLHQHVSKWNMYATLRRYAIPLLAQSIRRAQRIAIAMEAKGFANETKRTYYYAIGYSAVDIIFILYFVVLLMLAWGLGTCFPYVGVWDVR